MTEDYRQPEALPTVPNETTSAGLCSPAPAGSARRFTVEEIRDYLEGGLFTRSEDPDGTKCIENTALLEQIDELEDEEDGILATTERREWHKQNADADLRRKENDGHEEKRG